MYSSRNPFNDFHTRYKIGPRLSDFSPKSHFTIAPIFWIFFFLLDWLFWSGPGWSFLIRIHARNTQEDDICVGEWNVSAIFVLLEVCRLDIRPTTKVCLSLPPQVDTHWTIWHRRKFAHTINTESVYERDSPIRRDVGNGRTVPGDCRLLFESAIKTKIFANAIKRKNVLDITLSEETLPWNLRSIAFYETDAFNIIIQWCFFPSFFFPYVVGFFPA